MKLEQSLYKYFGYSSFRTGQKEVITSVLEGKHTLAMLATGTGKSVCYQLPTYLLNKPTVIISPLVSLMQDQVEQLKLNGEKRVVALNSFLSYREKMAALRQLHTYMFIFLSPEMLTAPFILEALKRLDIGLFVVDEAHCISQWGYDFRPNYLQLGQIRAQLHNPLTLALTATATEDVRRDIKRFLQIEDCSEIITSVNRSNIAFFTETFSSYEDKEARLIELVSKLKKPGIIYFLSKKAAETMCEVLRQAGVAGVGLYHAGMDQEQRILIQQQFLQNQLQIICATSAFGMGINKENVRFVIHFHMPTSMEVYVQEVGRAGRDGHPSVAILLYMNGDESLPLFLLENEFPTERQLQQLLQGIASEYGMYPTEQQALESMRRLGFSEVQERIVLHFLNQENDSLDILLEKMAVHMQEGTAKKIRKWQRFYTWLFQRECYRNGIVRYFDEEDAAVQSPCCSNCGDDLELFYSKMEEQDALLTEVKATNWRIALRTLLMPEVDKKNEK
ncbi:MAG: RecQ family ATP-dependent DNA helicase [Bacillus sp. (in: firmicutes)]